MILMMKACFFAGLTDITLTAQLDEALDRRLRALIDSGVTCFYSGGERGWDMLCAMKVLELKKVFPQLTLRMTAPCPPECRGDDWRMEDTVVFNILMRGADSVEIIGESLSHENLVRRNRRLAECCSLCLSCHGGTSDGDFASESDCVRVVDIS